jgi:hypothetical protein
MADTVATSVIVASLGDNGPSFVSYDDGIGPSSSGALHVTGAVNAPEPASGFGSALLVDFVSIGSVPAPTQLPPTVSGYGAMLYPQEFGPVVPGGIHQT